MDITSTLKRMGFDQKQAFLYMKALELGEASMTQLARSANIKRPSAYLAAEKLLMKGLLSETKKGKRKFYSAAHPRRLSDISRLQSHEIEELVPQLVALYHAPKEKPKIQVFEGEEGVIMLYRELYQSLSNKEEALWFSNIGALGEHLPEALVEYKKILVQLKNPRIRELYFGDAGGKRWSSEIKPFCGKNHFLRFLPTDFEFGLSDNLIFGNKLVIFSLRGNAFVTVIESSDVAKTYRALFEWAWKQGKSP